MRISDLLCEPSGPQHQLPEDATSWPRSQPWAGDSVPRGTRKLETTQLLELLPDVRVRMQIESGAVSQVEAARRFEQAIDATTSLPSEAKPRIRDDVRDYELFCRKIGFPPFPVTPSKVALSLARFVDGLPSTAYLRHHSGTISLLSPNELHQAFYSLRLAAYFTEKMWNTMSFLGDPMDYNVTREVAERLDRPFRPKPALAPRHPSPHAPKVPGRHDVPDRGGDQRARLESFGEFASRFPDTVATLREQARLSDPGADEAAATQIKRTLQMFEDSRRRQKLHSVYIEYLNLAHALAFAPHPMDRLKLGVFALAHLQGPYGDRVRESTASLHDFVPWTQVSHEISLDNLGIIQRIATNPADLLDGRLEREAEHWKKWRAEIHSLYVKEPEPSLPPLRNLTIDTRSAKPRLSDWGRILNPPASPLPSPPESPEIAKKPLVSSKGGRSCGAQTPAHGSTVSTTLHPPARAPTRTGRPVGRPRKHPLPASQAAPAPAPARPRRVSPPPKQWKPEVIGVLPDDRRPPPFPLILPSFTFVPSDEHSIAIHRPRRVGTLHLKMLPLVGSGLRDESDDDDGVEVEPPRTRKRRGPRPQSRDKSESIAGSDSGEAEERVRPRKLQRKYVKKVVLARASSSEETDRESTSGTRSSPPSESDEGK